MPETPTEYAAYLERSRRDNAAFFLAHRLEDDAIVGFLNISEIVRGRVPERVPRLRRRRRLRGPGLHARGLELLLREAFTTSGCTGWRRTSSRATAPSIALAKRCGFEREGFSPRYLKIGGRWRDHERWAIRAETWRARR